MSQITENIFLGSVKNKNDKWFLYDNDIKIISSSTQPSIIQNTKPSLNSSIIFYEKIIGKLNGNEIDELKENILMLKKAELI